MNSNPFIRPLPKVVPQSSATPVVSSSSISQTPKISRGMDGSERAKSIQAIANDIQARTARIEHLRIMSEKMNHTVKNSPQKNASRIAFLAGQLNQDF
jgi:hypothetical protein